LTERLVKEPDPETFAETAWLDVLQAVDQT
jgi:hypothetical protein